MGIKNIEQIKDFVYALDAYSREADPKRPRDHRSYVYALCEKTEDGYYKPFYIGEGKGARVWAHEYETKNLINELEERLKNDGKSEKEIKEIINDLVSEKIGKIDDINRSGNKSVEKFIIKWGMTENEAFMAESALINLLRMGVLKFDKNCTDKLTNIVQGHTSEGEEKAGSSGALTIKDFCDKFAKKPISYEELVEKQVKAVFINIKQGYLKCLEKDGEELQKESIKQTACGNWRLRDGNFGDNGVEYVFVVYESRIVGIFKIKEVHGKKVHKFYECLAYDSEYPHDEGAAEFRISDYKFAEEVVKTAGIELYENLIKKELSSDDFKAYCKQLDKIIDKMKLDDIVSEEYKEKYKKQIENENKDPAEEFEKSLERKYMILEDTNDYSEYMYRRVIYTSADNVNKNVFDQNPVRYIR